MEDQNQPTNNPIVLPMPPLPHPKTLKRERETLDRGAPILPPKVNCINRKEIIDGGASKQTNT
jgi:hypothetical protein